MAHPKRAIIYLAWGEKFVAEIAHSVKSSALPKYDIFLVTDRETPVPDGEITPIRVDFKAAGHLRKTELPDHLPEGYDSFLFLDSDTVVLDDIELGFLKAEKYGIAIAPATHYSLNHFWGFGEVMAKEGVSRSGQLLYNSGVIFFAPRPKVMEVLRLWQELSAKYQDSFSHDQPMLTLALEKLDFNPYTLSIGYNYHGMGDLISGIVRIWHSHLPVPENINTYEKEWPPRRVVKGKVIYPERKAIRPWRWLKRAVRAVRLRLSRAEVS